MKARMRRLSVSVDSGGGEGDHGDGKNTDASESRIDRVKKLLSSPLTRRKSSCNPPTTSAAIGSSSSSKVFGNSLSVLAHQDQQQQQQQQQHSPPSSSGSGTSTNSRTSVKQPYIPYIMTRLCDFIECESGLTQEGLFRVSGNAKLVDRLRNSFDATGDAPLETDGDVPSAAALLKLFLRELPEPVIPLHVHGSFLEAAKDNPENKDTCVLHLRSLVNGLPDENYYMLKYLSCFLNRVSLKEGQNRMNSSSLGIVFGPNLFRVADDLEGLKEQAYTNQIVSHFISEYSYIFGEESGVPLGSRITRPHPAATATASSPLLPLRVEIPDIEVTSGAKKKVKEGTKSLGSIIDSGSSAAQATGCVIPLLTVNNEELTSAAFQKGKKRKERRLSALDQSGSSVAAGQPRSCSEERPSPEPIMNELDIRRCNSSEEMSCDRVNKSFSLTLSEENLLDVSPHPSLAKRHHLDELDETALVRNPSPSSLSESSHESNEARRTNERTERTAHIRRPPINRAMRMNALKQCSDVTHTQGSCDSLELLDNDDESATISVNETMVTTTTAGASMSPQSENVDTSRTAASALDNEAMGMAQSDNSSNIIVDYSPNEPEIEESAPPLDPLHLNASSEPLISEHRYSWPYVAVDDDSSVAQTASYPLVQHAALLKAKSKATNEAPVSPSAFRSFLHQRASLRDPTIPPSPPIDQYPEPDKRSLNETPAVKEIKKRIHVLKRKLKEFEADYEKKYGYRPSHDQKMNSLIAKPIITELNKLRADLKDLHEDIHFRDLDLSQGRVQSPFQEKIERQYSEATSEIEHALRISRHSDHRLDEALHQMQETLDIKRSLVERPSLLETMSPDQVMDEKLDLQKALLKFESIYGRPDNRHDRDIMRPMYDRYRTCKRMLAKMSKASKSDNSAADLQPILENVAMSFESAAKAQSRSEISLLAIDDRPSTKESQKQTEIVVVAETQPNSEPNVDKGTKRVTTNLNLHELPFKELLKQLRESREEKRHLRKVIKNFEDDFFNKVGRKVERADRVHLETVYNNYKHTKGKLRLLEALVAKSQQKQHYL